MIWKEWNEKILEMLNWRNISQHEMNINNEWPLDIIRVILYSSQQQVHGRLHKTVMEKSYKHLQDCVRQWDNVKTEVNSFP